MWDMLKLGSLRHLALKGKQLLIVNFTHSLEKQDSLDYSVSDKYFGRLSSGNGNSFVTLPAVSKSK